MNLKNQESDEIKLASMSEICFASLLVRSFISNWTQGISSVTKNLALRFTTFSEQNHQIQSVDYVKIILILALLLSSSRTLRIASVSTLIIIRSNSEIESIIGQYNSSEYIFKTFQRIYDQLKAFSQKFEIYPTFLHCNVE